MNLLTPKEAAIQLRVSKVTLYRMIKANQITGYKVGGQLRIPPEAIDTYWQYARNRMENLK